jgi:mono/diheme cytochrome c family protein
MIQRSDASDFEGCDVRRLWVALSLVAVIAAAGLLSGCVTSSEEDAQTPTSSPTVVNSAAQTDSEGKTITAPAATAPAGGGGGAETEGGGGGEASGDVEAGLAVFQASCTGCHLADGMEAGGVGPKLAGLGDDAETIKNQVINGGGAMPAGLVSGTDLDNVTAYVVSIQ